LNDNSAISLLGLQNVTSLGGITIKDDGLNHFQGLENLEELISVKEIDGQLIISNNIELSSLTGLDSINPQSIAELILDTFDSLSFCSVKSICDYLSMSLGPSSISQNLTGYNNADEILTLCPVATRIQENNNSSIQIFPNLYCFKFVKIN
jgi:hypothetical protein